MATSLGDLYVTLTLKGVSEYQAAIANAGKTLNATFSKLTAATSSGAATSDGGGIFAGLGKAIGGAQAMMARFAASLQEIGRAAAVPFVVASAAVGGWVRAGLSGTTMGERLGLQFNLLSREIASLFIPVLNRVIEALQSVTSWFRQLSGPQQAFIGWTIAATVGLLGVATILPRLVGGLSAMGGVLKVLAANPIVAIVGAIAALLVGTESGRSALGRLAAAFAPIFSALGKLLDALKPVFDFLGKAIAAVADGIAFVVDKISGAVEAVTDWLGLTSEEERRTARAQGARGEGANRQELQNRGGQREQIQDAFLRFQSAALRTGTGNEPPTQSQMQIAIGLLQQMAGGILQPDPAPAPVS